MCAEKDNREILQAQYFPGREMGSQPININRENHISEQRINNADYFDILEEKISESKEMTDESVRDFESIQEPVNTTKGQRFLASLRNALGRPIRAIKSLFSKPALEIMGSIGITPLEPREMPAAAVNNAPQVGKNERLKNSPQVSSNVEMNINDFNKQGTEAEAGNACGTEQQRDRQAMGMGGRRL